MGLRGPKPKRKEVVWSSGIAYAAGLIATDGSLSIDGRHIDLTSKDKEQLENFMRCIGRAVTISTKKGSYSNEVYMRLQLSDVTLYEFFVSISLTPKKSHTIGKIIVPGEYFFDFLRGHHDGDGSFHSYFDPRWKIASCSTLVLFPQAVPMSNGYERILLGSPGFEDISVLLKAAVSPSSTTLRRKQSKSFKGCIQHIKSYAFLVSG